MSPDTDTEPPNSSDAAASEAVNFSSSFTLPVDAWADAAVADAIISPIAVSSSSAITAPILTFFELKPERIAVDMVPTYL